MPKRKRQISILGIGFLSALCVVLLGTASFQEILPEVPFVPTPYEVVAEMLRMADVGEHDLIYDLGCGDGRIVITAAKQFGCRGVGVDIDPERIKESRENAARKGVSDKVTFLEMDLFDADIREATVVTIYLLSDVNLRLRPKLLKELSPGTRLVSHDFDMDEWEPDDSSLVDVDWDTHRVYFWIIPANVAGTWEWTIAGTPKNKKYSLQLDQKFQRVEGKAFEDNASVPVFIRDENIGGNKLRFTIECERNGHLEQVEYEGVVTLHTLEGTVKGEGFTKKNNKWKAKRLLSTFRPLGNLCLDPPIQTW